MANTNVLMPPIRHRFWDANGAPLAFGTLDAFVSGSAGTLRKDTYGSADTTDLNSNPIVLDADGYCDIWSPADNGRYLFVLKDVDGNILWTRDYVDSPYGSSALDTFKALLLSSAGAGLVGASHDEIYPAATLGDRFNRDIYITDAPFNALGDGVHDNYQAITDALAFAAAQTPKATVRVPFGNFYHSQGIVVPDGVTLAGHGATFQVPPQGSVLIAANAVPSAVKLTAGLNQTAQLFDLAVYRQGVTPVDVIGVNCDEAQNVLLRGVVAINHSKAWYFSSDTVYGITATLDVCYSAQIIGAHFYIDSWPEIRIIGGRCGTNGADDYHCSSYFHILGTHTGGSGLGPNTLICDNMQFNQGTELVEQFIFFDNIATGFQAGEFIFTAVHVESLQNYFIRSNSSAPHIQRFFLGAGSVVNATEVPFFNISGATSVGEFEINGSYVFVSGLDLVLHDNIGSIRLIGGQIGADGDAAVNITGSSTAPSTLIVAGTDFAGGLNIDGQFEGMSVSTPSNTTMTATPRSGNSLLRCESYGFDLSNSDNRPWYNAPGSAVANPAQNGYWTAEFTDNTHLTIKARGTDGVTRSHSLLLT